jgi:hypothetical protein
VVGRQDPVRDDPAHHAGFETQPDRSRRDKETPHPDALDDHGSGDDHDVTRRALDDHGSVDHDVAGRTLDDHLVIHQRDNSGWGWGHHDGRSRWLTPGPDQSPSS